MSQQSPNEEGSSGNAPVLNPRAPHATHPHLVKHHLQGARSFAACMLQQSHWKGSSWAKATRKRSRRLHLKIGSCGWWRLPRTPNSPQVRVEHKRGCGQIYLPRQRELPAGGTDALDQQSQAEKKGPPWKCTLGGSSSTPFPSVAALELEMPVTMVRTVEQRLPAGTCGLHHHK